jgi:lipid II isoglutaminyl synthase (glutamine-hydrolysing)
MRKQSSSQPNSPDREPSPPESKVDNTGRPPSKEAKKKKQPTRQRASLRAGFAVMAGRTAGAVSRRLHIGGGTSIVGVVAQRIYPDIVGHLATELQHGSIMVTGTNGKTTTSSFVAAIFRDGGLRVWRNREGSNLVGGIASSLVIRAQPNGHLRREGQAISILEVDEAALPQLTSSIPPRMIIFTNLFRDQLDRYGEVDSITSRWQKMIEQLPSSTILVLNADDPAIAQLGDHFTGRVIYYGVNDLSLDLQQQREQTGRHQVADSRNCPACGHEYEYNAHFYSHLGHYHCPQCGKKRPQPLVQATRVQVDSFDRLRLDVEYNDQQRTLIVPLPGIYNIYNALAAIAASQALNIEWEPIISGIEQSKPAFGRGERIQADGKTMRLLLAKNPTGFNEVLRTLFHTDDSRHLLFVLNDNIADGRDISWIWDVDFERISKSVQTLVISGTRAYDLALRLKYAGISEQNMTIIPTSPLRVYTKSKGNKIQKTRVKQAKKLSMINNTGELTENSSQQAKLARIEQAYGIKQALNSALQQTPDGETLFVVPTYTGLLEVHRELEQRGFTPHYWEGRDA